ncbi:MAG: hypothetical protein FWE16_01350 [Firmicutes bacterium]|nr:hypothetical protein [Bacillota bacterium]
MIRIISFIVLGAAVISLVTFFMSFGTTVIDPFREAFNPFSFRALGDALWIFMYSISTPLILGMLGLIGLTMQTRRD